MTIWNQDKYMRAWKFASVAHTGQLVPGTNVAYINHIGNVAMEVMTAIAYDQQDIDDPDLLVQCALLHDVIEDTDCSYDDIAAEFGAEVADGVLALSKDAGLASKQDRMRDCLERIRKQPQAIWMVKLADRIVNLQPPPTHWSNQKIEHYWREAQLILAQLGVANDYLAERLKAKIEAYRQYF